VLKKLSILLIPALFALSCKKNESPVGVDILPDSDQLNAAYTELVPKITFTSAEDSMMTTNVTNSNLLGSVNDPVFGRFDASIYANFECSAFTTGASLGTNPVLDSAVLMLRYNTSTIIPYIGDTINPLTINVFPLTQKMIRDSVYYSTRNIAYDAGSSAIEGGQKTFYPRPYTKIRVNKDDPNLDPYPQMRIRLRKDLGEYLFNPAFLTSVSAFQDAFYGFYITTSQSILPQPSYGSVFYVNMVTSRILLYYHNDNSTGPILPVEISTSANSTRFGHFDHDYPFLAETQLAQQLAPVYDTGQNGPGKQNIYLQGAGGLRAKVEFPELLNWRDSNIVINKAELVFTIDKTKPNYYDAKLYPTPLKLFLEGVDPSTNKPEILVENIYAFGGEHNSAASAFIFNIPHTLAQTITKKGDITSFYLSVYQPTVFPHRVVLGGWGNTTAPVKLKLWYTRLSFPK